MSVHPEGDGKIFDQLFVESAAAKVGVNPKGGYVSSWEVKNLTTGRFEDILYQGKTQKRTGIPVLFPYYGKAEDMRRHGFGRDSLWKLETPEGNKVTMKLSSADISEDARAEYPHAFDAAITVEAGDDGSLIYGLRVSNPGNQPLPISPGLHPYWAVPHGEKGQIEVDGVSGFDAPNVDWDTAPPDNVYPYTGKIAINLPRRTISIEDITESGPVTQRVVVWSQTPKEDDFDFICVEPITGGDNAVNEDPILVQPGKEWNMRLRFTVGSK